jgi:hypothetical protein
MYASCGLWIILKKYRPSVCSFKALLSDAYTWVFLCFQALAQNSSVPTQPIMSLLQATSQNISTINAVVRATLIKDQATNDLIYLVAVEHQVRGA